MCETPNGKPTFTRKNVDKRWTDIKTGKLFLQTSETVVKWPKSKAKQEMEVVLQKLGDLASRRVISPTTANHVGYIVKNPKLKYNEKKWYIAYSAPLNYTRTKERDKDTIYMIVKVYNNEKLQLTIEQKNALLKLLRKKAWDCLISYCDESMIPKPIFDYLISNPRNKETYERFKREKQLKGK